MNTKVYHILHVENDIQPILDGPYPTPEIRDAEMRKWRAQRFAEEGDDPGGFYRIDVESDSPVTITVDSVGGGFWDDTTSEDDGT